MKQKINIQPLRCTFIVKEEIFVQNEMKTKSQALKIFVHEQRQTLIYTTQSAGSSTELTNQLAREQI